jgi:hypothetical protein
LDEGGDLNFASTGTKYFTLSSVALQRPFRLLSHLSDLRFDLIEEGHGIEYFHASDDRQATRDRVFSVIVDSLEDLRLDTVVAEKQNVPGELRDESRFYPEMLGKLLAHVAPELLARGATEFIVITDSIPLKSKRRAIEKGVKVSLAHAMPADTRYRICHHASKSTPLLQAVDYMNWAVFRSLQSGDPRSFKLIEAAVSSQRMVF